MTIEQLCVILATAFVGFLIWRLEERIKQRDAKEEAERQERIKFETNTLKLLSANTTLCVATATALQNGHTNGETHRALEHAQKAQDELSDYLAQKGVERFYEIH